MASARLRLVFYQRCFYLNEQIQRPEFCHHLPISRTSGPTQAHLIQTARRYNPLSSAERTGKSNEHDLA
jgi:hypothetical protein